MSQQGDMKNATWKIPVNVGFNERSPKEDRKLSSFYYIQCILSWNNTDSFTCLDIV